jgi:hypothetical protein
VVKVPSDPCKGTPIKTWADLKGRKVGVNRGSSVEREFVNREKELNLTILRFEDDSTTMQALVSGAQTGPTVQLAQGLGQALSGFANTGLLSPALFKELANGLGQAYAQLVDLGGSAALGPGWGRWATRTLVPATCKTS